MAVNRRFAKETDEIKTTNCPNCGAPTTITSAGQCEYCGSEYTLEDLKIEYKINRSNSNYK